MALIPDELIDAIRGFSDLTVDCYGIDCTLYIPTNLTTVESEDIYRNDANITYKNFLSQKVWINWAEKDMNRLRKLGLFTEDTAPIIAYFKNYPVVTLGSYIKVETRYIPNSFDTDEFEVIDLLAKNTYNSETIRAYKLAPRRYKK